MSTSPDDRVEGPKNVAWFLVHQSFARRLAEWAKSQGLEAAPLPDGLPGAPDGRAYMLVPTEELRLAIDDTRRYRVDYDGFSGLRPIRLVDTEATISFPPWVRNGLAVATGFPESLTEQEFAALDEYRYARPDVTRPASCQGCEHPVAEHRFVEYQRATGSVEPIHYDRAELVRCQIGGCGCFKVKP